MAATEISRQCRRQSDPHLRARSACRRSRAPSVSACGRPRRPTSPPRRSARAMAAMCPRRSAWRRSASTRNSRSMASCREAPPLAWWPDCRPTASPSGASVAGCTERLPPPPGRPRPRAPRLRRGPERRRGDDQGGAEGGRLPPEEARPRHARRLGRLGHDRHRLG